MAKIIQPSLKKTSSKKVSTGKVLSSKPAARKPSKKPSKKPAKKSASKGAIPKKAPRKSASHPAPARAPKEPLGKSKPKAPKPWTPAEVYEAFSRFRQANPEPKGELEHLNPYTLLVAVVLSAQATDAGVNKATRALFAIADTPQKMLALG